MRGYVEIKEDVYEDAIEHLYQLKSMACKAIKKLSEYLEEQEAAESTTKHRNRFL